MTLPRTIVIGPMKCGTTWLNGYLLERGDVCLPSGVKETFYFDRNYDLGPRWYRACFAHYDAARHRTVAEVAPSYFHSDEAPQRIRRELGPVALVVIVRDPVRRAWSHYCHMLRYGYTRLPLRQAAERFTAILDASRYGERIGTWAEHFDAESISICSFEKLHDDEAAFCRDVCRAMRIDFAEPADDARRERNTASTSASVHVAGASRVAAHALRRRRLHFVVNLAKRVGIKRLVYGGGAPPPSPSAEDLAWLKDSLRPDIRALGRLVNVREHRWIEEYL